MGNSVNLWIGIGRLGKDPEIKYLQGGDAVCNFSIACEEKWQDKQGQEQKKVEWVNIVAWKKLAEICAEYLSKGRQCYVEGKLQTRSWEKDGQKHYATDVVARTVTFLGDRGDQPRREKTKIDHGSPPMDNSDVPI